MTHAIDVIYLSCKHTSWQERGWIPRRFRYITLMGRLLVMGRIINTVLAKQLLFKEGSLCFVMKLYQLMAWHYDK